MMKKLMGLLLLVFTIESQAQSYSTTTCFANYGKNADEWMVLNINTSYKEVCYRCTDPFLVKTTTAHLSVPHGPRGTYITQHYSYVLSQSFVKSGKSTSVIWDSWFPQEFSITSDTSSNKPLYINFLNGESLSLECK